MVPLTPSVQREGQSGVGRLGRREANASECVASSSSDENVLEAEVKASQHCECIQKPLLLYFKKVKFMVCEFISVTQS